MSQVVFCFFFVSFFFLIVRFLDKRPAIRAKHTHLGRNRNNGCDREGDGSGKGPQGAMLSKRRDTSVHILMCWMRVPAASQLDKKEVVTRATSNQMLVRTYAPVVDAAVEFFRNLEAGPCVHSPPRHTPSGARG